MATFGCFAGLATGAMGALSSTEMQLLSLCDVSARQETSSQGCCDSSQQQVSSQRTQVPSKQSLFSSISIAKFAPEFNGISCFDTVFGS